MLIYGATIGAGFALLENILYISLNPEFALGDAILRGCGTSLLHMGCTALLADAILLSYRVTTGKSISMNVILAMIAFLPASAIHLIYNMFFLPVFMQMILTILLFIGLFLLIYHFDEKLIHQWLDVCISNDIALMSSIKRGKFHETDAGKYLLVAKNKFEPEVFFDICVYLGLYLELSIAAKSKMILKESGMNIPISEEEHLENEAKLKELKNMRNNIGTSGCLLLSPLINEKAVDDWTMNQLL